MLTPIVNIQFRSLVRCRHKTKEYRITEVRNELNEIGHHSKSSFLFLESI